MEDKKTVELNRKTQQELDDISVEIVNLLADKKVSVGEVDYIFNSVNNIISFETKIKRIDWIHPKVLFLKHLLEFLKF